MDDIYAQLAQAVAEGQRVALVTVVRVSGSTPRGVGTKMLVYGDGRVAGTIGGGKMEALTIQQAQQSIQAGSGRLVHYELDAKPDDVGVCGGEADVFVDVISVRPTLLIVGAGHVAMPVAEIGHLCDFRVVVIDDRADMLTEERFPHAAQRVVGDIVGSLCGLTITPDTFIVIITRGHAHDQEALKTVIDSPAAYIGMIGSRRKVRTVFDNLKAEGVDKARLSRVRSPIGLNIGAQTPAEIAVSILAEITMLRSERDGRPMKLEV